MQLPTTGSLDPLDKAPRSTPTSPHWVFHSVCEVLDTELGSVDSSIVMPVDPLVQVWATDAGLQQLFAGLVSDCLSCRPSDDRLLLRFGLRCSDDWATLSLSDNCASSIGTRIERVEERSRGPVMVLGGELSVERATGLDGVCTSVRLRRAPDIGLIALS